MTVWKLIGVCTILLGSIVLLGTYAYCLWLVSSLLFVVGIMLLVSLCLIPVLGIVLIIVMVLRLLMQKKSLEIGPQGSVIYSLWTYRTFRPLNAKLSHSKMSKATTEAVELEAPRQFSEHEMRYREQITERSATPYRDGYQEQDTSHEHVEISVEDIIERAKKRNILDRDLSYILGLSGKKYHIYQELKGEKNDTIE